MPYIVMDSLEFRSIMLTRTTAMFHGDWANLVQLTSMILD